MDALGKIYHASLPVALVPRHRREISRLIRQYFPMVLLEAMETAWGDAKISERRGMILVAGCLADLTLLDHLLTELENPYLHRDAFEAALSYGRIAGAAIVERLEISTTVDQRVLLVRLLGATGDPQVLPHLLRQNLDEDVQVRMEAISALGEIDDQASLRELVSILKEPDPTFHEAAIQSIQNLSGKHPSLGASLLIFGGEMVREEDGGVRKAGYTLIALGHGRDVSRLIPGLTDPAPAVRQTVVRLIAQRLGPASFETLLPGLGDQDARVRRTVLSVLGRDLLSRQPETLMTTLTDADVWVRAETAYFLAQSTQPDVGQALMAVLERDQLPVRLGALRGLAEVGCGGLFPQVMDLASGMQSPVEVRQAAMAAVARSGRPDALRLLTGALSGHEQEIQVTAAELMGSSHDRRYVPVLLRELERSAEPLIKKKVVDALIQLKAIEAVPRMLNYLTDPELKDSAYTFFTSLGSENVKLIENEAQSVDFQTKLILTEILKHLESL
jgi:HEAT repeat protein